MEAISAAAQRPATVRDPTSEITRMAVPQSVQPRLRGFMPSTGKPTEENPFKKPVFSAHTPEGEEPTLAELTGVKVDRLKHVRMVRQPTPEEVLEFADENAMELTRSMTETKSTDSAKARKRVKTEVDKLSDEIGS